MQKKHQIVFNTCPDEESALDISETLVGQKLAACVNIIPGLQSIYSWQGKVESGNEYLLMIKTREDLYSEVEQTIRALHPYELPEIISVPMSGGLPGYLQWIDDSLEQ